MDVANEFMIFLYVNFNVKTVTKMEIFTFEESDPEDNQRTTIRLIPQQV